MSLDNLTLFLNTHSSASDLWPMFSGQLKKFWPGHPQLVVASNANAPASDMRDGKWADFLWENARCRCYDPSATFGQQYLQGLSYVTTDYVLPLLEDMILYAPVDVAAIEECLKTGHITRLIKTRVKPDAKSYRIQETRWNLVEDAMSMQPSVWPTEKLLSAALLRRHCPTPWQWETMPVAGSFVAREPAENGPQRGRTHRDSLVFPYICTAINKGKWNLSEYPKELGDLLREYGIDSSIRGTI